MSRKKERLQFFNELNQKHADNFTNITDEYEPQSNFNNYTMNFYSIAKTSSNKKGNLDIEKLSKRYHSKKRG